MTMKQPTNVNFDYKVNDIVMYRTRSKPVEGELIPKLYYEVGTVRNIVYSPSDIKLLVPEQDSILYFIDNPAMGLLPVKPKDILKKM